MDDGWEGYMSPPCRPQGTARLPRGNVCGVMNTDQFFATDSAHIGPGKASGWRVLQPVPTAFAYVIAGHTDSRASDAYNMRLSFNRANSVARVAQSVGARIADVRGYGERMPRRLQRHACGHGQEPPRRNHLHPLRGDDQ